MKNNNKAVVEMIDETPLKESISANMRNILESLGEDPTRKGLVRTPDRAEKALRELAAY